MFLFLFVFVFILIFVVQSVFFYLYLMFPVSECFQKDVMPSLYCSDPLFQNFRDPRKASLSASAKEETQGKGSESKPSNLDIICQHNCAIFYVHANHLITAFAYIKCTVRTLLRGPVDIHCKFFEI